MKTTTYLLFSNGTDFMWWQDANCCRCRKAVWYNEKTQSFPKYKCALQRDIEQQAGGIDEINIRTFNMIHGCAKCPMFVDKNAPTPTTHKSQDDGQPTLFTADDFARGESMVNSTQAEPEQMASDDVKDNTENHSDVADNAESEPKKAETAQISAFAPLNGNSIAPMIEMPTMRPKYGQTGMQIDILDLPGIPNEMKERMLREKCKRETDELLHAFTFNEHMCIALAPLVIAHMAWMYTFKVLDYCREHRIQVLKKLGRAVQHIRSEYMAMLRKDLDTEHIARIEREAERVHQECQTDFFIMWLNAKTQIINVYRDDPDATMKTDAFMAVLLIRILKEHNERMDAMIRERLGRCTNTIMNPWMVKLRDCMDAYTGGEELTIDTQIQLCTQIVHKNIAKIEWHTT